MGDVKGMVECDPALILLSAVKGASLQPVQVRPEELSVHLGSYPGGGKGDRLVEALGTAVRVRRAGKRAGCNTCEA